MAVKKRQRAEEGAPGWIVTYGDMVTLLLTFFVMLLAMSEVKQDDAFVEFMQAIREAFGYEGGMKQTPLEEVQVPRNVELRDMLIIPVRPDDFSESNDKGLRGRQHKVTSIRPAEEFAVGGKVLFPPTSSELTAQQRQVLAEFAGGLVGFDTQIEVRGHSSLAPLEKSAFADHLDLAYCRARAVADELVATGIDPRRIVIVAAGANEPVTSRAYTPAEQNRNDVVEVLQVDRRVAEFQP